jgi:hypothetical protein
MRLGNWTAEQRVELVALVREQAQRQIEGDPELREMVDWMVYAAGMQPSPEAYRLVFLASAVLHAAGGR